MQICSSKTSREYLANVWISETKLPTTSQTCPVDRTGRPRAAETALELQLERLDNAPGNTTFREIYESAVTLFSRHSDEAAQIASTIARRGDDVLDVLENGIIRVRSETAEEVAEELVTVTGRPVWFSSSSGMIYVSRPTQVGLDAVARLQMAVKSGADEEVIRNLLNEIAVASTRGSGNRVVLGAWKAGGGYIGDAVENGDVFFDTGNEVWDMLEDSGVDPWLVNEAFLRRQLEAGVERIDFTGVNVDDLLSPEIDWGGKTPFRVLEATFLNANASKYGYIRVGKVV